MVGIRVDVDQAATPWASLFFCSARRWLSRISFLIIPALVTEGSEIRQGCRFISSLIQALGLLPGVFRCFLPCSVDRYFSRLRHLGWEQCSHGLTSGPLSRQFVGYLGIRQVAVAELLDGTIQTPPLHSVF